MADEACDDIVVKKECESNPGSPDNPDNDDSDQNKTDSSGQKQQKVWGEEETRSLIQLHKALLPKFEDSEYTRKKLWDDLAADLQMIGYEDTTSSHVKNRLKTLRMAYKRVVQYNAKHVEKKEFPYLEDLRELYSMDTSGYDDIIVERQNTQRRSIDEDTLQDTRPAKKVRIAKSPLPAAHVDLATVVTTKKKNVPLQKVSKIVVKKKVNGKYRSQPMFQCGQCLGKFSTSQDLHNHPCKSISTPEKKKLSTSSNKKVQPIVNGTSVFHWNSMSSMQFLEILSEYQKSSKNSKKAKVWETLCVLMTKLGYGVQPSDLEKKWKVLSSNYLKAYNYNKRHKDKKKCAFYKRLSTLHRHPLSFKVFNQPEEFAKMTVEVSPFSYSSQIPSPVSSKPVPSYINNKKANGHVSPLNGTSELISWLDSNWKEFKELERKREEAQILRHMELMEMLSYLVDGHPK